MDSIRFRIPQSIDRTSNLTQNRLRIILNLMVRKPYHCNPECIQKLGPQFIFADSILGEMIRAIAFDIER